MGHSFKHLFSYSFICLLLKFYPFENYVHKFRSKTGDFYLENGVCAPFVSSICGCWVAKQQNKLL